MKANVSLKLSELTSRKKTHLLQLFEMEDKVFSDNRANYEIISAGDEILFEIEAKDAVALRACLTAITKTLSIYERTEQKTK